MRKAWRHATVGSMGVTGPLRGTLSGASAYLANLRRIGWAAPSFDCVQTRSGVLLYFGEEAPPVGTFAADPGLIKKFAAEDYEREALAASRVAKDLSDLSGLKGYPWDDAHAHAALLCMDA